MKFIKNKYLRFLILIAFLFVYLSFMSNKNISIQNRSVFFYKDSIIKDTTITIRKLFLISIPIQYAINSGFGDDTQFVQIINNDGSILINSEFGVEEIENKYNFKLLNKEYNNIKIIKRLKNKTLCLAHKLTDNKFRNIKGKIFIKDNDEVQELLTFNCTTKKIKKVVEIASTISSIY